MKTKFSDEKNNEIARLYIEELKSSREIKEIVGCSTTAVFNVLRRMGLNTRPLEIATKTYSVNRNYFEKIDNHDKGALFGFALADGCIVENNRGYTHSLVFGVHPKDTDYIEFIKSQLEYTGPIKIIECKYGRNGKDTLPSCRMSVCDNQICKDLIKMGCGPRKSFNTDFPKEEHIPKEFLHSFIRGVFEGDGWLSVFENKRSPGKYISTFGICVTGSFGNELVKIVEKELKIKCNMRLKHVGEPDNVYTFSVGGNLQILKFMQWIYRDGTFYMSRKYNKYLELLSKYNGNIPDAMKSREYWVESPDKKIYKTNNISKFSRELNLGSGITKIVQKGAAKRRINKGWICYDIDTLGIPENYTELNY